MIHDALSNWRLYFNAPHWNRVFDFLSSLTPEVPDNERIELQGDDIFAIIMSYATQGPEKSLLETHDAHIDVQMSLKNAEVIDWHPRSLLKVQSPYEWDRTFYHCPGPAPVRITNAPGYFTVLFPDDAHMPMLMTGSTPEQVKKVVVKVRRNLHG